MASSFFATSARADDGAPDDGAAFEPRPLSRPNYVAAPATEAFIPGEDGGLIHVEVNRPVTAQPVPVVLVMTPYAALRPALTGQTALINRYVPLGYAVAIGHLPGTGRSTGCLDLFGPSDIEASTRVIEWLAAQPWSSGRVGMAGGSYEGGVQVAVAASGDPQRLSALKVIVPTAPPTSFYDTFSLDGVPYPASALSTNAAYVALGAPRNACSADLLAASAELEVSGNFSPYAKAREHRANASRITAATLVVQGFADGTVVATNVSGFFDQISREVPHAMLLGPFEHAAPDKQSWRPHYRRADYRDIIQAWYDRFLLGLDTGVEKWPAVQVQDSQGRWRVEPSWPTTSGPVGQLALTSDGLGSLDPRGETVYSEVGSSAIFTSEPFGDDLRLTGQPVLDLWVTLDRPDAHVAATLEILMPDGTRHCEFADQPTNGSGCTDYPIFGARSVRHLDPIIDGVFTQARDADPPTGVTPVRVAVRMHPLDVVVPAGARLKVTIGGTAMPTFPTAPSGAATNVTVLHDCAHMSALRFRMPSEKAEYLNVREPGEAGPLLSSKSPRLSADGGGIATQNVCGRAPLDPQAVEAGRASQPTTGARL